MVDFLALARAFPHSSRLGRILRLPFRLLPSWTVLPIIQGPVRGFRWIVGSSGPLFWLGSYERDKLERFLAAVPAGGVVFDIGAHAGLYSLLAGRRVGQYGKVLAFEPSPRNLYYLRQHITINRLDNISVVDLALGDRSGSATFHPGAHSLVGRLSPEGSLQVSMARLDDLFEKEKLPCPHVVKIDIEGGEVAALNGARNLLLHCRPTIFLSTHGAEIHEECLRLLRKLGYDLELVLSPYESGFWGEVIAKPLT